MKLNFKDTNFFFILLGYILIIEIHLHLFYSFFCNATFEQFETVLYMSNI